MSWAEPGANGKAIIGNRWQRPSRGAPARQGASHQALRHAPETRWRVQTLLEGTADLRSHPWANHAPIGGLEWRMPAFIHERGAETSKEDDMRRLILPTLSILAVTAATAFASFPVQAQYALCLPVRGCIPTTQASYNACYTLARQRGWTDSDNAPKGGMPRALDGFIWRCLQGRIAR